MTAENILNREFYADAPNEKWLTDVTEFKYYVGAQVKKLYLSAILDLYDRRIVAYKIGDSNNNKLVFDTFDEAVKNNPNAHPLFHSDRGFQYTNKMFNARLKAHNMRQSMFRVGRCMDNGPMEGYRGLLKSEMYYLQTFKDEKSLRSAIEKYIHFYNYERFQERFETRAPMEVRTEALNSRKPAPYPIPEKFAAFGFNTVEICGHCFDEIEKAIEEAKATKDKPTAIIMKTVKGKGVSFMENKVNWHGSAPNKEQYDEAMAELDAAIAALDAE